jgi:hypothetical protein
VECGDRAAELERMKQGHCAIKFLLSWLVAGSGKVYGAQLLWIRSVLMFLRAPA